VRSARRQLVIGLLITRQDRDQLALREREPHGDGGVIARDEFGRALLAFEPGPTASNVVVDRGNPIGETLMRGVDAFKSNLPSQPVVEGIAGILS
jgi:hypothetical protein